MGGIFVSLLFLQGQFQAGSQTVLALCVFWVFGFLFLVSVYARLGFPTMQISPFVLVCQPCGSDQTHQLQGSHQASISGHVVEETSLLQEVRRGAILPDFSFVQDDHPARAKDADMKGAPYAPKSPPGGVPALDQAPSTFCKACCSHLPTSCPPSIPISSYIKVQ